MSEKERVYCENCIEWNNDDYPTTEKPRTKCTYVLSINYNYPVKPQKVYGYYNELNKDGDCPHFKDKNEGLGVVGTKGKLL